MTNDEMDQFMRWRDEQRSRPRVMTWGEYTAWHRGGGDVISSASETNAFPGGLTIKINTPAIIGGFKEDDDHG